MRKGDQQKIFHKGSNAKVNAFITLIYPLNKVKFKISKSRTSKDFINHLRRELTQCDVNKDVGVSDWLQFTGIKIQVKHMDHLFRIYIKSMGEKTVCRIEESLGTHQRTPNPLL